MIEITFNTNAWLGLRKAQTYGSGEYKQQGRPAMMFYGKKPGTLQQRKIRREFEEMQRRNWEDAEPLGGNPQDVFRFELMLGTGDISGDVTGGEGSEACRNLEILVPRIEAGEPVRIWYSESADDYCGLLWFAWELCRRELLLDNIFLVKVPEWGKTLHGNFFFSLGTAETGDNDWHRYVKLQQHAPVHLIHLFVQRWSEMQEAGTSLRAVINGQPVSVPDDFYDGIIRMTIDSMGEEFRSISVLSRIIQHGCRIPDSWLLGRLEKFVEEGTLIRLEQDKDLPDHCLLKKNKER